MLSDKYHHIQNANDLKKCSLLSCVSPSFTKRWKSYITSLNNAKWRYLPQLKYNICNVAELHGYGYNNSLLLAMFRQYDQYYNLRVDNIFCNAKHPTNYLVYDRYLILVGTQKNNMKWFLINQRIPICIRPKLWHSKPIPVDEIQTSIFRLFDCTDLRNELSYTLKEPYELQLGHNTHCE
jgi:hypothetical protein